MTSPAGIYATGQAKGAQIIQSSQKTIFQGRRQVVIIQISKMQAYVALTKWGEGHVQFIYAGSVS